MTDEEWEATFVTPYLPEYPEIGTRDESGWGAFVTFWVVIAVVIAVAVVAAVTP